MSGLEVRRLPPFLLPIRAACWRSAFRRVQKPLLWGLDDLSGSEAVRFVTSILLFMYVMTRGGAASFRGGAHGWKQPADSRVAPYPWKKGPFPQGLFITNLLGVCSAEIGRVFQGPWTILFLRINAFAQVFHIHIIILGFSWGRTASGDHHFRRWQTYPSQYAKHIASLIFKTLCCLLEKGSSPTEGF